MTPRQKKRLSFAAGAVLILVAIAFIVLRPAELAVIKPVRQDVVEVVVASGTLRAVRQSMVGAESPGVVESLEVSRRRPGTEGRSARTAAAGRNRRTARGRTGGAARCGNHPAR